MDVATEEPEYISDSVMRGEYNPNSSTAEERWNTIASLSTSTAYSQWDSGNYNKILDSADDPDLGLYKTAKWLDSEEELAIEETENGELGGVEEEEVAIEGVEEEEPAVEGDGEQNEYGADEEEGEGVEGDYADYGNESASVIEAEEQGEEGGEEQGEEGGEEQGEEGDGEQNEYGADEEEGEGVEGDYADYGNESASVIEAEEQGEEGGEEQGEEGGEEQGEEGGEEQGEEGGEEEAEYDEEIQPEKYLRFQTARSQNSFTRLRRDIVARYDSQGFQQGPKPVKIIEEPDEQETESSTPSASPPTIAVSDDTRPFTLAEIDAQIYIRQVNGKGRCAFAKHDFRPGDVIFSEIPTLAAIPSLDPPLWEALSKLHSEEPLDLPPIWHLAALYSLTKLSKQQQQVILEKWVPDENKNPGRDAVRVLGRTRLGVDARRYERYLQVWRYNSFGHHIETDGLVLYNRISMLAHDCAATACWHYGDDDAFVLRARQFIKRGQEITISYVGDEDLFKSTNIRQDKLAGWLFKCSCRRCAAEIDTSRGFRCASCGAGTVFFKTEKAPNSSEPGVTFASPCTLCASALDDSTIRQYVEFEMAYIARLEETDKTDVADAEAVYGEAQRVFSQHWVLFTLDGILFDAYRDRKRWIDAATHQTNRIQYATQVIPQASYTLAWLYEERGDALGNACADEQPISGFFRNIISYSYETAMNMLIVLSGWRHTYTLSAGQKLARYHSQSPS